MEGWVYDLNGANVGSEDGCVFHMRTELDVGAGSPELAPFVSLRALATDIQAEAAKPASGPSHTAARDLACIAKFILRVCGWAGWAFTSFSCLVAVLRLVASLQRLMWRVLPGWGAGEWHALVHGSFLCYIIAINSRSTAKLISGGPTAQAESGVLMLPSKHCRTFSHYCLSNVTRRPTALSHLVTLTYLCSHTFSLCLQENQ